MRYKRRVLFMLRLKLFFCIRKMNGDRANFAVGSRSHSRSPDAYSRSDDTVQISFLEIAAGIFPHQTNQQITGKELTVMSKIGRASCRERVSSPV